jgi:growth factor-regulated tyrosine kinase substrate
MSLWVTNSNQEKATATQDIALNLDIADSIRSGKTTPKAALACIKRKVSHKNPNVQILALQLIESCIKNAGDQFLFQVATPDFLDLVASLARNDQVASVSPVVQKTAAELIQNCGVAFKNRPDLSYACTLYNSMKSQGSCF